MKELERENSELKVQLEHEKKRIQEVSSPLLTYLKPRLMDSHTADCIIQRARKFLADEEEVTPLKGG